MRKIEIMQAIDKKDKKVNRELHNDPGTVTPSFEYELGARLSAIVDELGEDISVQITGKSWKQIRRYCEGAEPPVGVLKGLADASKVSIAYLVDGFVTVAADAEVERTIIDWRIDKVRNQLEKEKNDDERTLRAQEKKLLDRSAFFARVGASLLNRAKYARSYEEYLRLDFGRYRETIDPVTVMLIQKEMGISPVGENAEHALPQLGQDFVMVPRYDIEASAGPGALTAEENVVDYMAFQARWVRATLGLDPARLALISAKGDSMEPTIRAGDLLLVDRGVNEVEDDAIYIIILDGHLMVKRLQRFIGGVVSVKSDNAAYVEQTLNADELAAYAIIAGRVRWIGRLT